MLSFLKDLRALTFIFLISACAPNVTPTPLAAPAATAAPLPTTATAATPLPTPSPTPKPKTLTIATYADIETLAIHRASASASFMVLAQVFETLFTVKADNTIEPLLATSFTASGANVYTIKLRSGVKFADGAPFNASAVKANLDWILKPENKAAFRAPLVDMVSEVQATAEDTIVVKTKFAFAPLPYHLAHRGIAIISPNALGKDDNFLAANASGTGPFQMIEWKKGASITLQPRADYWGGKPKMESVTFRVVKDDAARVRAVETGDADIAVRVPAADAARLRANKDLQIELTPTARTTYVYFNTLQKPLDDKRVRQAINYGVDKKAVVDKFFGGAARVSDAPLSPAIFGYAPHKVYERDVEKAKALLKEAGIAPGAKIVLHHPIGQYPQDAFVADALRAQLKDIGLDVELRTLEWASYVSFIRAERGKNTAQMALLSWSAPTLDADYALYNLFHKSSAPPGFNTAFYDNASVNDRLEQARASADAQARAAAYAEAMKTIWDDAPWLFLYHDVQITALRKNISGVIVLPSELLGLMNADMY